MTTTDFPVVPVLPVGSVYLDRAKPLSPQIIDDLKVRMLSGQYQQCGPLPTTRALAEFYEATDATVSSALNRLIRDGWITKEGYGKYRVAAIIPPVAPSEEPIAQGKETPTKKPAQGNVAAQHLFYCPTCGIWTQLPAHIIAAIPPELALACVADKTALVPLMLDPCKRVGGDQSE